MLEWGKLSLPFPHTQHNRQVTYNCVKARMEKLVADMHLLTGNLHKAFSGYESALTNLKSYRDILWAAAANEGLAVTAIVMKLCEEVLGQKAHGFPSSMYPNVPSKFQKVSYHIPLSLDRGHI